MATMMTAASKQFVQDRLLEFDRIMRRIDSGKSAATDFDDLLHAVLLIAEAAGNESHSTDLLEDFNELVLNLEQVDHARRAALAACLTHILSQPHITQHLDSNIDKSWKARLVAFIESQVDASDLYGTKKPSQTYQKVSQLAGCVQEQTDLLTAAVQQLTSLDRLGDHRQEMLRTVNSKHFQLLVLPFLPDAFKPQLSELYKRVEVYLGEPRTSLAIIEVYSDADQAAQDFLRQLNSFPTSYCEFLLTHLVSRLQQLLADDVASCAAAQPADVTFSGVEKKHPLHMVGQEVNLGILISNRGAGYANGIRLVIVTDDSLLAEHDTFEIGRLAPGSSHLQDVVVTVASPTDSVRVYVSLSWNDFDGTPQVYESELEFFAQVANVDWDALTRMDVYSLEPVESKEELVGRKEVLDRLIRSLNAARMGSAIIRGQKRVGKTSIAKAVASDLQGKGYHVIYLEGGDYTDPDPSALIARLGTLLCKKVSAFSAELADLEPPVFYESLSPITEYLDQVIEISGRRIVFILDEFDELPRDLYFFGGVGDALFLTLRSLSGRANIGFILVGGEKMEDVLQQQGERLNKWLSMSVDYFSRETDWGDYVDLVQRPVVGMLEYSQDALLALHEVTAGNPYFTNLVCQQILDLAVARRDSHVTVREVEQAIRMLVEQADTNTFQHFWTDGIFEVGDRYREKSERRRRILIALRDVLSTESPAPLKRIDEHELCRHLPAVEADLHEFVSRKVLVSLSANVFQFKVPLFHEWLKSRGVSDLISTFHEMDFALHKRKEEEALRIRSDEIVALVEGWGPYRGWRISEDRVRTWLEQFGGIREQRAVFPILQHLRFYTDGYVRAKMKDVDSIVRQGLTRYADRTRRKRSDIIVSYLDGPGKSGSTFATLYINEASIYAESVVERDRLPKALKKKKPGEIQAIVFIDDFVGSGTSAARNLKIVDSMIADYVGELGITKVVFVAIVAYVEGWQKIQTTVEDLRMKPSSGPLQVYCCEMLGESACCFGDSSATYPDAVDREFARDLVQRKGQMLQPTMPLGFSDLGMNVVFEHGCPNNSLPVLWSEAPEDSAIWYPLFKRH